MEREQEHTTASNSADTGPPASDAGNLKAFQVLVGITTSSDLQPAGRPGQNIGLYKQIAKAERRRRCQFITCASFIDIFLIAQIGFAAILTALGASESP